VDECKPLLATRHATDRLQDVGQLNTQGVYSAVDDVSSTCYSTLEPVSFKLSSTLTDEQSAELTVELQFYGLLRYVMPSKAPYYAQGQTGVALLQRACVAGRGLHSSTSQLSLSRFCHYHSMDQPAHATKGAYDEPKSGRVQAPGRRHQARAAVGGGGGTRARV
jgi:hypothetical protein